VPTLRLDSSSRPNQLRLSKPAAPPFHNQAREDAGRKGKGKLCRLPILC